MSELWTPGGTHKPDPTQYGDGFNSMIELYDSDLLVIERVLKALEARQGSNQNLQAFVDEAKERFGLAGYVVEVNMYQVTGPGPLPIGTFVPDIIIKGRTEKQPEFDREQMAWEVQQDILGIDENPGTIRADGTVESPKHTTSFAGSTKTE